MVRPLALTATLVMLSLLGAGGCTLLGARGQVAELERVRVLRGSVAGSEGGAAIVLAVDASEGHIEDFFQLDGDGRYYLLVAPGRYRVIAFQDRNGDRVHQPDEPWTEHAAPVDTSSGLVQVGVDLLLPGSGKGAAWLEIDLSDPDLDSNVGLSGPPPGTLASLDDDRFSRENARLGLWRPIDFLTNVGGGLFFLEPYRSDRTPVVFVHGAGGTPLDFEFLIEHLDRERFQPWVLSYPSAHRLEPIADYLHLALAQLRKEYDFDRVLLVAHSMGGLVTRAFLNEFILPDEDEWAPLLVSLSTPWQGHAAAQSGVERSPVVLPSWRDMAPSSVFLETLFDRPLEDLLEFHLFFGFEGHSSRGATAGTNDGSVAVASQLAPAAQREATRLYGFTENHTSILRSPEVSKALNALLEDSD